jgi:hypothetical protein
MVKERVGEQRQRRIVLSGVSAEGEELHGGEDEDGSEPQGRSTR